MESRSRYRRLKAFAIGVLCLGSPAAGQIVSFSAQNEVRIGGNPSAIAAGDFNGDGRLDLAVTEERSSSVLILLGFGNGFFQNPVAYRVGSGPRAIAAADFNRDGRQDLVAASSLSGEVSLLLGAGSGAFQSAINFSVPGASFVLARDFDLDGNMDVAVASSTANGVVVLHGNGVGGFPLTRSYPVGPSPVSLASADLNGDGRPDLASANLNTNQVSVLLGGAGGIFLRAINAPVAANPASVSLTDVDGDGRLDLAAVSVFRTSSDVSVALGLGNGFFQASRVFPLGEVARALPGGVVPPFLLSGDFNLDSRTDLLIANRGSSGVSALLGLGGGFFSSPFRIATGEEPSWIIPADFNADGRPDLVVANRGSGSLSILLNTTPPAGQPSITGGSVLSGATLRSGPIAGGQIVTIRGSGFGPAQPLSGQFSASGLLFTNLGGTRVLFDGVPAPLISVQSGQATAVVPFSVTPGTVRVQVESQGRSSGAIAIPSAATAPGVFTADGSGAGQGAILNQDGSSNSVANPAAAGTVVSLFATGGGQTDPPGIDGKLMDGALSKPLAPVSVSVGGMEAEVLYAGAAPGLVSGVLQINARLPASLPSGDLPVVVTMGAAASPEVTVAVR